MEPSGGRTSSGTVIDCHGHLTAVPAAHARWRGAQLAALRAGTSAPAYPSISDDELAEGLEDVVLALADERGVDLTLLSPRASTLGHHEGDQDTNRAWAQASNDLVHRAVGLHPDRFAGIAQLPQSVGDGLDTALAELDRCVGLGFVGCLVNPDPSGGHWTAPPLTDRYWYPLFERLVEHDLPAMIHTSASDNPAVPAAGALDLGADTAVFAQLLQGDLFEDLPDLRLVIPHGGGAVPYHWPRYQALAASLGRPPLHEHLMGNVFFDTCVYHQPGMDLLTRVVAIENLLFGSEAVGSARGIDRETGHDLDDTLRYVEAAPITDVERELVLEVNARRVHPRLAGATVG